MSEYYFCAGGSQRPIKEFDFQRENSAGYAWEVRFPGMDAEASWELDDNPYPSLEKAVMAVFPHYNDYGLWLSIENAAKLCLELGLILGTGVKVEDEEE